MVALTWVVDDVATAPLQSEHGYAMWIDAPGGQVLLDAGGSGKVLLHNLEILGLDPSRLSAVVLSHAHDDHTGGLPALLDLLRPGTTVHAHPDLFTQRYSAKSGTLQGRGIRITHAEFPSAVGLRLSAAPVEVVPGVWTTGTIAPRPNPEGRSRHHFVRHTGQLIADPYADDLSVRVDLPAGRSALICGCCHAGLLNTVAQVQRLGHGSLVAIAGGVHLAGAAADVLQLTTQRLRALPNLKALWLGHCSGQGIQEVARAQLPGVLVRSGAAGQRLAFADGEVMCA